jgi:hypothetical protein
MASQKGIFVMSRYTVLVISPGRDKVRHAAMRPGGVGHVSARASAPVLDECTG